MLSALTRPACSLPPRKGDVLTPRAKETGLGFQCGAEARSGALGLTPVRSECDTEGERDARSERDNVAIPGRSMFVTQLSMRKMGKWRRLRG